MTSCASEGLPGSQPRPPPDCLPPSCCPSFLPGQITEPEALFAQLRKHGMAEIGLHTTRFEKHWQNTHNVCQVLQDLMVRAAPGSAKACALPTTTCLLHGNSWRSRSLSLISSRPKHTSDSSLSLLREWAWGCQSPCCH